MASPVLERGLDIPNVRLVLLMGVPLVFKTKFPDLTKFTHSVGRTSRFGAPGWALVLLDDAAREKVLLQGIAKKMSYAVDRTAAARIEIPHIGSLVADAAAVAAGFRRCSAAKGHHLGD